MKPYIFLALAIVSELIGTSMLKASAGFTKIYPSIATVVCFGMAMYMLSLSLRGIPLGVAYAIWSGVGTMVTAILGFFIWKETLNLVSALGIVLIIAGVVLINLKPGNL